MNAPKDPWYKRTEFWTMAGSVVQCPLLWGIPGAAPVLGTASAVLAAAAPLVYMYGRGQVKVAKETPPASIVLPTSQPAVITAGTPGQ